MLWHCQNLPEPFDIEARFGAVTPAQAGYMGGLPMTEPSYNGTPVHRIRTGDLNRALRDLLKRRAYAEKQMTKAWGTADTNVMREAREGWRPVIRACDEELAIISRELERRRSRRSDPTAG